MAKQRKHFWLESALIKRLDAICKRIHCPKANRNAAVTEAITEWCEKKEAELKEGDRPPETS